MVNDVIIVGPNYSANTVDKASEINYTVPYDFSKLTLYMQSCGGGGGGGAHAYFNSWYFDRHERGGGGGGGAGLGLTVTMTGNYLILYNFPDANTVIPFHFPIRGSTLTVASVGRRGAGGEGSDKEGSGTVTATASDGTSADPVRVRFTNGNYYLQFQVLGGTGGGGGKAHAEYSGGNSYGTAGSGATHSAYMLDVEYYDGSATRYIHIRTTGSKLFLDFSTYSLYNDVTITYEGATIGTVVQSESSSHFDFLDPNEGKWESTCDFTWRPGYSWRGSDGQDGSNAPGGTYTTSTGVTISGGSGGRGESGGYINGSNGSGGSLISMTIERNNPFCTVLDLPQGATQLQPVLTERIKVRNESNNWVTVKDVRCYDGQSWKRLNGEAFSYNSGSIN